MILGVLAVSAPSLASIDPNLSADSGADDSGDAAGDGGDTGEDGEDGEGEEGDEECAEGDESCEEEEEECEEGEEKGDDGKCYKPCDTQFQSYPYDNFEKDKVLADQILEEYGESCWCSRWTQTTGYKHEYENCDLPEEGEDEEKTPEEELLEELFPGMSTDPNDPMNWAPGWSEDGSAEMDDWEQNLINPNQSVDPNYDPFGVGQPANQNTAPEDDGLVGPYTKPGELPTALYGDPDDPENWSLYSFPEEATGESASEVSEDTTFTFSGTEVTPINQQQLTDALTSGASTLSGFQPGMQDFNASMCTQELCQNNAGLKNNNPGNVETGNDWIGELTDCPSSRFECFENSRLGARAMAIVQNSYENRGIDTIRERITTWAPPVNDAGLVENDTGAYIESVSNFMGIDPDEPFSIKDPILGPQFMRAVTDVEVGKDLYSDQQILDGYELAFDYDSNDEGAILARARAMAEGDNGKYSGTIPSGQNPSLNSLLNELLYSGTNGYNNFITGNISSPINMFGDLGATAGNMIYQFTFKP
jgi:hypothetical protein